MPLVTGKVTCLQVEDDLGFAGVLATGTTTPEYYVLWDSPSDPSAFTRVMQSMWLSFLKESLVSGNQVELSFDSSYDLLYVRIDQL